MPKLNLKDSATGRIITVKILDKSQTDGRALTGLTYSSAGLIIATRKESEATGVIYHQADSDIENVTTLGTYEAPTTDKCRFREVSSTNFPGHYEIHLANARFESCKILYITVTGATNAAQVDCEIQCENDAIDQAIVDGTVLPADFWTAATRWTVKKNTAGTMEFRMQNSEGVGVTGLTGILARVMIDGGAFATMDGETSISECSRGWYKIPYLAAEVNGDRIAMEFERDGARTASLYILTQS